jgi:branched-chain amino acid transport system substrate-binding protein
MFGKTSPAGGRALKIGFVGPRSGVVAPFGEGGDFVISEIRKFVAAGIASKGVNHPVQIIDKDNQSDPTRAAEIALALIKSDRVDLMLAASNGDTVNPVSDQCDKNGVPCMTTDCPMAGVFLRSRRHTRQGLRLDLWCRPEHGSVVVTQPSVQVRSDRTELG